MQTQSEDIKDIAVAFKNAQAVLQPAAKGKENPFFHSKYADLDSIWDSCRDALHQNDIAVVQGAQTIDGKPHMETKLIHSSGQWLSSFWELIPTKPDPQAMGSAITYMRRYSLAAMVGVITEDDDGNAASNKAASGAAKTPDKQPEKKPEPPTFWERDSYAVPHMKGGEPDWIAWDKAMLAGIAACIDLEKLSKLQLDNADSLREYEKKFATSEKELIKAFTNRMAELSQGPIA